MNPIDTVLSRLDGVKDKGKGQYVARCPAHEDKSPSLSVKEGDDGRVLLHCHAACPNEAVVSALGIAMTDLFEKSDYPTRRDKSRPSNSELLRQLSHEMTVMLVAIGHYENLQPLHKQDKGRTRKAADRIRKILGVLYGCK